MPFPFGFPSVVGTDSFIGLARAVLSLSSGRYTVTRYEPSAYIDGRLQSTEFAQFEIVAAVQPLTGRELKRLPEGMRTRDLLVVYSTTELKTQGPEQEPDVIAIGSDRYEVQSVERWAEQGAYFRVIAAKQGR